MNKQNLYWKHLIEGFKINDLDYVDNYINNFFDQLNDQVVYLPDNLPILNIGQIKYLLNKNIDIFSNNIALFIAQTAMGNQFKEIVEDIDSIINSVEQEYVSDLYNSEYKKLKKMMAEDEWTKQVKETIEYDEDGGYQEKTKSKKNNLNKVTKIQAAGAEILFLLIDKKPEFIYQKFKFDDGIFNLYQLIANIDTNKEQQEKIYLLLNNDKEKENFLLSLIIKNKIKIKWDHERMAIAEKLFKKDITNNKKIELFLSLGENKANWVAKNETQLVLDEVWTDWLLFSKKDNNQNIIEKLKITQKLIKAYQKMAWMIPDKKLLKIVDVLSKTYQNNNSAAYDENEEEKYHMLYNNKLSQYNQIIGAKNLISKLIDDNDNDDDVEKLPTIFDETKIAITTANAMISSKNNNIQKI